MTYRADYLIAPPEPSAFPGPETVPGEFWVYYHLTADGEVLYIGKTGNPSARTKQHEGGSPWFGDVASTVWFGPLDEVNAAAVERELIGAEQPPNNLRHTERRIGTEARMFEAARRVRRLRIDLATAERHAERCREAFAAQSSAGPSVGETAERRNTQESV